MRVLLAEDDLTSRSILGAVLEKWGYDPVVVSDGEKALAAMRASQAPDLAILDWQMPGLDGLTVCRRIRAIESPAPPYIIILTSNAEKSSIVEGLEAGANDYLAKPYDSEELRARLNVGRRMIEMQTRLQKAQRALMHEAMHDPLTGVLNRRAILEGLTRELTSARHGGDLVSVGLCDLDHFKQVNDRHGHQVGDDMLCGFVRTAQANLRECDLIGRYGGEEFLIVAPRGTPGAREEACERVCNAIGANPMQTRCGPVAVTVSIGVASGNGYCTAEALLCAADAALYQAKRLGRNCVAYAKDLPAFSKSA